MKNLKKDTMNSPDEYLDEERIEEAFADESESEETDYFANEDDEEIIKNFNRHKSLMDSHWDKLYSECEEDWDIYNLDQWTEEAKLKRGKRPAVTMDICRKFVKTVVAETFRNPPGVKLSARKQSASLKAQAVADAIRFFEDRTGAIYSYSYAKECAAVGGIGWLKVTYRYDEEQAMPAVIDVDRVDDPLSIKIDPDSRELDGSDMLYAMEEHGKKDGKTKYTYWWKDDSGIVKWAIICDGKNIEDKGVFPSSDIPLVPVYGEISRIRNTTKMFGLIRQLRDNQRMYNYVLSEGGERLALTPKSPIRAPIGGIPDKYLSDWKRSMVEPVSILFYNSTDAQGNTVPAPSREQTEPDTSWLAPMVQLLQQTSKETVGIYDTALGENTMEKSGVAIKARVENADRGHLVYDEHLQIAIKHVGRIMLSLLEPVVTPAGVLPLLSEDGSTGVVPIGNNPMLAMQGAPQLPDLDTSDLDISVSAAPAYATRKQEGLDNVNELLKILPPEQSSKLIPSLIRNMDFPGSDEFANILDPNANQQDPMMLSQQNAQLQDQLNQLNQQLMDVQNQNMQLTMQLNNNTQAMLAKAEMDNNTKMVMNQNDNQTKLMIAQGQTQSNASSDQTKYVIEQEKLASNNRQFMAEMARDTEKDNLKIAQETAKMRMNILNSQQNQPLM